MSPEPSRAKAAVWMVGWLSMMTTIAVAGREAAREISLFQIMELRSLIGLVLLAPLIARAGGLAAMRTSRPVQHVARNLAHYGSQLGWFYALTLIPIGQVVSIEFTMPVWTAILAALFLGERITLWKALAIALGIAGVAVIVRPATDHIETGQLFALGGAVGFAVSVVLMKSLTRTESTVAIIFWMLVIQSAVGFVPCLLLWQNPSAAMWGWIGVVAFCGTFSHFCMARAMTYADATIVLPMDFVRVPLTAAVGWLVYAERIDLFTALGAAMILAGNLVNLRPPTAAAARA